MGRGPRFLGERDRVLAVAPGYPDYLLKPHHSFCVDFIFKGLFCKQNVPRREGMNKDTRKQQLARPPGTDLQRALHNQYGGVHVCSMLDQTHV